MSIHVHIERLVLEGLDARPGQGPVIGAALEQELARLLATQGLDAASSRSEPHLPAGELHLGSPSDPPSLGRQIGGALYHVLNPSPNQSTTENISRERFRH